ncbi:hypothetical protein FOG50_01646 [Hanseniaspora uvarum]|nr:hypothetical protein FOG50_01646 [Hanseniaspora uvarum]
MFRLTTFKPLNLLKQQSKLSAFNFVRYQSNCANKVNIVNLAKLSESAGINNIIYTSSHEWLAFNKESKIGYLGITQYAANHMGDVTYVELSDVEEVIEAGESIGSVESVKSSNEIYTPYKIEVLENNMDVLNDKPQLVSEDAMGDAWLLKVKVLEEQSEEAVLDLEKYETYLKGCDE